MDIADSLLREAKHVAAERGITLEALVEESLRAALPRGGAQGSPQPFRMRTFAGDGLQPGLSWGDWNSWKASRDPRR